MQSHIKQLPGPLLKKIFSYSIDSINQNNFQTSNIGILNRVNKEWHAALNESKFNSSAKRMAQIVSSKKFFDTSLNFFILGGQSGMFLLEQRKSALKNSLKATCQHISDKPKKLQLELLREAADEIWEESPSYQGEVALETAREEIMNFYAEVRNPLNIRGPEDKGVMVAYMRLVLAEEITALVANMSVQEFSEISLKIHPDSQSFERLNEVDQRHRYTRNCWRVICPLLGLLIASILAVSFTDLRVKDKLGDRWFMALIFLSITIFWGIPLFSALVDFDRSNSRVNEYYRDLDNNPFTLFHSNEEKKAGDEKKEEEKSPSLYSTYGSFSPRLP